MATAEAPGPTLAVAGLNAWYGESHILHGVDFEVRPGEVVTLLGRNGAGKTTTLKAIMGIVGKRRGSVAFAGRETIGLASDRIARLGMAICPEERAIFASLSVRENLMLPPRVAPGGLTLERIFALFPNLAERLASGGGKLSGGEQQMLAIARILRTGARFLMLDEPTEGLAPVIIRQIGAHHRRAQARGFHHPAGRAELQFRQDGFRPLLRDGARPHRTRLRQCRPRPQQHGEAACATWRVRRAGRRPGRREAMFLGHVITAQQLFGQLLIGLINGSFYALLSLGLAVIFGMLNIVNFAHGALYMVGAFVAYFLLHGLGLNYWGR